MSFSIFSLVSFTPNPAWGMWWTEVDATWSVGLLCSWRTQTQGHSLFKASSQISSPPLQGTEQIRSDHAVVTWVPVWLAAGTAQCQEMDRSCSPTHSARVCRRSAPTVTVSPDRRWRAKQGLSHVGHFRWCWGIWTLPESMWSHWRLDWRNVTMIAAIWKDDSCSDVWKGSDSQLRQWRKARQEAVPVFRVWSELHKVKVGQVGVGEGCKSKDML